MSKFTFQVDRAHKVLTPIKLFPTVELTGDAFEVPAGEQVVYRGVIELGGKGRYTFDVGGRKGYSADRAQLENALEECYDELVRV